MLTPKDVFDSWAALYEQCIVLQTTKENDAKKYRTTRSRLVAVIDDIDDVLKNIDLPPTDIDRLVDIRKRAQRYLRI